MQILSPILFILLLIVSLYIFFKNIKKLYQNIKVGRAIKYNKKDNIKRWKKMILIALGQKKMIDRPISGLLHIIVYIGFLLINIELLEILVDGVANTHRIFQPYLGHFYYFLINTFEILAFLIVIAVFVFWIRRNVIRLKRFMSSDLKGWGKLDGNLILYIEFILMSLFLIMNATDIEYQLVNKGNIISHYLFPLFTNLSINTIYVIEKTAWWLHIIGILFFLNYLYYSKHLHILLAFPNTFFANLNPYGKIPNNSVVKKEVELMMNIQTENSSENQDNQPVKLGANDVTDLTQLQLLNAYTCTECGRCSSVCPANLTGKALSPRKIMMKTRDRIEEYGKNKESRENKQLLNDYITKEEIWACTTCNACTEACPINIDPLSIIIDLRQYLILEKAEAPTEWNTMMSNIENNGAPWAYSQQDRNLWTKEK